jgi:hypothetical protein
MSLLLLQRIVYYFSVLSLQTWVLTQQSKEREDKNFSRKCLLCRLQFEGCRADYLYHLSRSHNMQLGRPENLVFIDDLLNCIEARLQR